MKNIKTTDYVSEYEFRRFSRPKYQTSVLRPVMQERGTPDEEIAEGRRNTVVETGGKEKYREAFQDTRQDNIGIDHGEMRDGRLVRKSDGRSSLRLFDSRDADVNEGETIIVGGTPREKVSEKKEVGSWKTVSKRTNVMKAMPGWHRLSDGRIKRRKKDKKKEKRKTAKKAITKVTGSLKSVIADMEKSANASWDSEQRWDMDSAWDYARDRGGATKGFRKGMPYVLGAKMVEIFRIS